MTTAPAYAPTLVRSRRVPDVGALLDREIGQLPEGRPFAWLRDGDGLVGWGTAARVELDGPDRFVRAQQWWDGWLGELDVADEVGVPGSGPVVFGTFAFADDSAERSVLVVPEVVVGRRDGVSWVTTIDSAASPTDGRVGRRPRRAVRRPAGVRYAEGSLSVNAWRAVVAAATARIRQGDLQKVVLARDLVAVADSPVDQRWLLRSLSRAYPDCWTFAVDGLIGATPELLVRREGSQVLSRVLAGTAWREGRDTDDEVAARLLASAKDREEHTYAARSAVDALTPHCIDLTAAPQPEALRLANVVHLSTEVSGRLVDGSSALALAAALHPTAAVGGTPTDLAVAAIGEIEGMDRGRYAGPVGWLDAAGDGEWGIALRCAQADGAALRLFAGCGIVADSDPDTEVAETLAKFRPIRDALEGDAPS